MSLVEQCSIQQQYTVTPYTSFKDVHRPNSAKAFTLFWDCISSLSRTIKSAPFRVKIFSFFFFFFSCRTLFCFPFAFHYSRNPFSFLLSLFRHAVHCFVRLTLTCRRSSPESRRSHVDDRPTARFACTGPSRPCSRFRPLLCFGPESRRLHCRQVPWLYPRRLVQEGMPSSVPT